MYSMIIKQKLRTTKGTLKHFGINAIGLLAVVTYIAIRFYFVVLGGGIGTALSKDNIFYLLLACTALSGFRVVVKKAPIITMNAATLHYLYFSKHFKRIVAMKYLFAFIKSVLFAAILASFICGFQLSGAFLLYFLLLLGYLFLGVLLSWSRYHVTERKLQVKIYLCYIIISVAFLMESGIISLFLNYCFVICVVYYVIFGMQFNLPKYRTDLAFIDESTSAASQYNMAKMVQLAADNEARKSRRFFLYHFPIKKENAIFFKCIIELIRAGSLWGVLSCLLMACGLFYRTSISTMIPIIGENESSAAIISVLLIMIVFLNISEMIKKQAGTLLSKHKQGLFIPIKKQSIMFSYFLASILIFAILTMLSGLIFGSDIQYIILFFLLFIALFAMDFFLIMPKSKMEKIFHPIVIMLSFILGFIFFI